MMTRGLALAAAVLLLACGGDGDGGLASGGSAGVGGSAATGGASSGGASGAGGSGGVAVGGSGGAASGGSAGVGGGSAGGGGGSAVCPPVPGGVDEGGAVGDYLADIVLKDCSGAAYPLRSLCGAKAVWVFSAHGWCPKCKNVAGFAESVQQSLGPDGLRTAVVLVQNASGNVPGPADCSAWQSSYGLSDTVMLYDDSGALKPLLSGSPTSQSAFVDAGLLVHSKLDYQDGKAQIEAQIQTLLGP